MTSQSAGYSAGTGPGAQKPTQSANHTGSGGSWAFQSVGLAGTSGSYSHFAPSGANGVILLFFTPFYISNADFYIVSII
jgi:hypothetical protein